MTATNYDAFKMQQLKKATTRRVHGHLLERSGVTAGAGDTAQKWIIINPCLCTWDSPTSPCPCLHSTIWWVLESDVIGSGKSDRKSHDGHELHYFDISIDAKISVESTKNVAVTDLTDKAANRRKQLLQMIALIKSLQKGGGTDSPQPGVVYEKGFWEGLAEDLAETLEKIHGALDFSEVDLADVVEVLSVIIPLVL